MKTLKTALCGLIFGLAAIPLTPAMSQSAAIVVNPPTVELPGGVLIGTEVISHADLDLAYADERKELDRRIDVAASTVCDRLRRQMSNPVLHNKCENGAKRTAYRQIHMVRLGG